MIVIQSPQYILRANRLIRRGGACCQGKVLLAYSMARGLCRYGKPKLAWLRLRRRAAGAVLSALCAHWTRTFRMARTRPRTRGGRSSRFADVLSVIELLDPFSEYTDQRAIAPTITEISSTSLGERHALRGSLCQASCPPFKCFFHPRPTDCFCRMKRECLPQLRIDTAQFTGFAGWSSGFTSSSCGSSATWRASYVPLLWLVFGLMRT